MPGCYAGVDLAAELYYKTGAVELTLVPASGCTNCTGADTSCCRDPMASNSSSPGTCFAVDSCNQIPVGAGKQGILYTVDAGTGAIAHQVSAATAAAAGANE